MSKDNNDVVIINLDRPRELRFGHKALKRLSASTGKSLDEMEDDNTFDLEQLEEIFFYGLQRDARENGETLLMEEMEDILDCAESYEYLVSKMTEAMNKAMGSLGGNGQPAGKQSPANRQNTNRGTGRNQ